MPRGNLEGIYPRIITLKRIIQDIRDLHYDKAFRLLRQHKIDINMLVDVDPAKFLANIPLFLDLVPTIDHLTLFINSLVDAKRGPELAFMEPIDREQEIREEHEEFMGRTVGFLLGSEGKEVKEAEKKEEKVNTICEAIKNELVKRNKDNKYLLPILTICVKK